MLTNVAHDMQCMQLIHGFQGFTQLDYNGKNISYLECFNLLKNSFDWVGTTPRMDETFTRMEGALNIHINISVPSEKTEFGRKKSAV